MNGLTDLLITINKEKTQFQIGNEEPKEVGHDLLGQIKQFSKYSRTHEYGFKLLKLLFPEDYYNNNLRLALNKDIVEKKNNIHFRLNIQDEQLEELYWEGIRDRDEGQIFGRNHTIFFSRATSSDQQKSEPLPVDKLKVLVIISGLDVAKGGKASKNFRQPIDKQKEKTFFDSLTGQYGKDIELKVLDSLGSIKNIKDQLGSANVLFVISNGWVKEKDVLMLKESGENGEIHQISMGHLGEVFKHSEDLKLVVFSPGLNSKEEASELNLKAASCLAKSGVPAVVALRNGMLSESVELFTSQLLQELANALKGNKNKTIDQLINHTRKKIWFKMNRRQGGNDWVKPVLFMQDEGYLFQTRIGYSASESRKVKNPIMTKGTETQQVEMISRNLPVVFCGYSGKDEELKNELMLHLQQYKDQQPKYLKDILEQTPGGDERTVEEYLDQADFIILLLSADFKNEDIGQFKQKEKAVKRKEDRKAELFPILVRRVGLEGYLEDVVILPLDKIPIASRGDQYKREDAFADIVEGHIIKAAKRWIFKDEPKVSEKGLTKHKTKGTSLKKEAKAKTFEEISQAEAFRLIQQLVETEEDLYQFCDNIFFDPKELKGSDIKAKCSVLVIKCFRDKELKKSFVYELNRSFRW